MKRDEELKRLINYAKAMGCTVEKKYVNSHKERNCYAECTPDLNLITLYILKTDTKMDLVLHLIHELAHYKSYINTNRTMGKPLEHALIASALGYNKNQNDRKLIFNGEFNDLKYWNEIVKDCGIEIRASRIEMQKELDILWYELYYLIGDNVKAKVYDELAKIIKEKYKCA